MNMKTKNQILDARPVYAETLSSKEFVGLKDADRLRIKRVQIVAPKLGSKSFGGVKVEYKTPIYKVR